MGADTWVDKAKKQISELTPKAGFNVVAVDGYEKPGEALYLVGHFTDRSAAEKARAAHEKKTKDLTYVYGPKGAE